MVALGGVSAEKYAPCATGMRISNLGEVGTVITANCSLVDGPPICDTLMVAKGGLYFVSAKPSNPDDPYRMMPVVTLGICDSASCSQSSSAQYTQLYQGVTTPASIYVRGTESDLTLCMGTIREANVNLTIVRLPAGAGLDTPESGTQSWEIALLSITCVVAVLLIVAITVAGLVYFRHRQHDNITISPADRSESDPLLS
eukprot:CAMPEP_0177663790 /NCGR_PEP_ID=MMETSP0447-20121125/20116_1 /TAXON_ID=0 /ORGANISM="Stygamoeba regulata, Strain BSH-02190019" /LENGTH=199 /DNA_ID=CAMNT_0019169655 /DNA_START=100 /DNA_END=699 /DNA_ORIENTATION=+